MSGVWNEERVHHRFPVDRDRLALEHADGELGRVVDQAKLALRRHEIGDRLVVLIGRGEACDKRDR
jgi:hypothetical protein